MDDCVLYKASVRQGYIELTMVIMIRNTRRKIYHFLSSLPENILLWVKLKIMRHLKNILCRLFIQYLVPEPGGFMDQNVQNPFLNFNF